MNEKLEKALAPGGVVEEMFGDPESWKQISLPNENAVPKDREGNEYPGYLEYTGVIFRPDETLRKQVIVAAAQAMQLIRELQEKYSPQYVCESWSKMRDGDNTDLLAMDEDILRYAIDHDLSGLGDRANRRYNRWFPCCRKRYCRYL